MSPGTEALAAASAAWGLGAPPRFIRRVANFVYESSLDGRPVILRLTEPSHRSATELAAELEWMDYLSRGGLRLAAPLRARDGSFVRELPGPFLACVFVKAPGGPLSGLSPELIRGWGRYLGRMHKMTRGYRPAGEPRQEWDEDYLLGAALRSHDENDVLPYRRLNELLEWLRSLPEGPDEYGLVHCDLHQGNFFVHENEITAFDFDDCCRHWFAYDLSQPLFSILHACEDEGLEYAPLESAFLEGYALENELAPIWLKRLPAFMQYRAALIYHWIETAKSDGVFDEKGLEWCRTRRPWFLKKLEEPLLLI